MTSRQWRSVFEACWRLLGKAQTGEAARATWCAWTTFERLGHDAGAWLTPLPGPDHILDTGIARGSAWERPVAYAELARLVVPARFFRAPDGEWPEAVYVEQDIDALARALADEGIPYRRDDYVLELRP
ncbi:MAG: hypothetical protein ACKPE6_13980 [Gammaproteobacteria bacterium]